MNLLNFKIIYNVSIQNQRFYYVMLSIMTNYGDNAKHTIVINIFNFLMTK